MCLNMRAVQKGLKEIKRGVCQEKGGIGFVWNLNLHKSQSCLLILSRVRGACRAASILSLSSCPHVPLPRLMLTLRASDPLPDLSVTTPAWVWTTPRRTVCLLPLHVCVCVLPIALCMWTSLSDKTSVNCVFLCACQWPRGTTGPRNYLSGHSCISTAVD